MAKRSPLVCQHLEDVSRDVLNKYQKIIRQYVRRRQGVYALYRKEKLYYVGLASNLRSRINSHLKDRHGKAWDRFSVYLTIGDSHLKEMESLILRVSRPTGNKQAGKFLKSQNLRRSFAKNIRALQRDELVSIIGKQMTEEVERENGRSVLEKQPVLARYINGAIRLRAKFKRKWLNAKIRRDGLIRYKGKTYRSPSLAAAVACKRKTCNGWFFWTYERAPGDWVPLDELRK